MEISEIDNEDILINPPLDNIENYIYKISETLESKDRALILFYISSISKKIINLEKEIDNIKTRNVMLARIIDSYNNCLLFDTK